MSAMGCSSEQESPPQALRSSTIQFGKTYSEEVDATSSSELSPLSDCTPRKTSNKTVKSMRERHGTQGMVCTAAVLIAISLKVDLVSFFDTNSDGTLASHEALFLGRIAGIACVLVLVLGAQVLIYHTWENAWHAQKTESPFHHALKGKTSDEHHIDYLQQEYSKLDETQLTRKRRSSSVPASVYSQRCDGESQRTKKKSKTVQTVEDYVRTGTYIEIDEMLADQKQIKLNQLAKQMHKWNFNFFEVAEVTKEPLTFTGFICLGALLPSLPVDFAVNKCKLRNFLSDVESAYREVPYHNSLHGANVAHLVWSFCEGCGLQVNLSSDMQFTLVLAGLVHDVHHPGITASFLEKAGCRWRTNIEAPFEAADMELSILYNDQSPLENMHCAQTFHILSKDQNAFLSGSTTASIRKVLVRTILGTDMAKHAETMTKLSALIEHKERAGKSRIPWWWPSSPPASTDPEKRAEWERNLEEEFMMELFLHAADVGTPSLPIDQWRRWNSLVQAEFHKQGDLEQLEFGDLISPPAGFDRRAGAKAEHVFTRGFMQYVSLPLFKQIDTLTRASGATCVASGVDISCCLENLETNLKIWDETVPSDDAPVA